jgi:hypothetical protein
VKRASLDRAYTGQKRPCRRHDLRAGNKIMKGAAGGSRLTLTGLLARSRRSFFNSWGV